MATMIVLPPFERIKAFSLADLDFFTIDIFDNEGMLNKAVLQSNVAGVDTNLIIVGELGNLYNFYLLNLPIKSEKLPSLTVYVHGEPPAGFLKKKAEMIEETKPTRNDFVRSITNPIEQKELERAKADYLNSLSEKEGVQLGYKISGDLEIAPRAVYDRRGWTYFDFREVLPSDRLPVVLKVIDGYDSPENSRFKDGFLIVESVSLEGWTLKNGDKVVCVERD